MVFYGLRNKETHPWHNLSHPNQLRTSSRTQPSKSFEIFVAVFYIYSSLQFSLSTWLIKPSLCQYFSSPFTIFLSLVVLFSILNLFLVFASILMVINSCEAGIIYGSFIAPGVKQLERPERVANRQDLYEKLANSPRTVVIFQRVKWAASNFETHSIRINGVANCYDY